MLQTHSEAPRSGHDFSRIPTHRRTAGAIQAKLTINKPGDQYEQEADRVSAQVMRMEEADVAQTAPPAIQRLGTGYQDELAAKQLQRRCNECEEEKLQRKDSPRVTVSAGGRPKRR